MITPEVFTSANRSTVLDWTEEKLLLAKTCYEAGESPDTICGKIGYSWGSILRVLKIMGVTIRPRGAAPVLTDDEKEQIKLLLKDFTQQEIANTYGINRGVVQKIHANEKKRLAELAK